MTYAQDIGFVELTSEIVALLSASVVTACVRFVVTAGFIDHENSGNWNVVLLPT